jgi:hypothetical protein
MLDIRGVVNHESRWNGTVTSDSAACVSTRRIGPDIGIGFDQYYSFSLPQNAGANPPDRWFRNSDARIREQRGNIKSSLPFLYVLLCSFTYYKCLKFQIKVLCHGRGREFESRRPRHSFQ